MGMPLLKIFGGMFVKQGFVVKEYQTLDLLEFENDFLKGMVTFTKPVFKIRWKMKEGIFLYDCPMAPGHTTCQFGSAKDLLDFLQRRLVWKKQS
jgi:hypothetical protein